MTPSGVIMIKSFENPKNKKKIIRKKLNQWTIDKRGTRKRTRAERRYDARERLMIKIM